ncbi:chromosome partitioning protein [Actinotalea sp. M2MS4P-6]|uniref:MinD/ParA family ATP-binding protein n=1 Tax=Actinotalea sp. M2MS4P-6 TaxID=2983762 RepID=UPI0021E481BD|nr:chromosome partitioning protein [Actinotalea sp. M2MS4P-6]MCV2394965.1 chromosome partitioning protein [Actinotalea sp. M2MS4P-6]
MDSQEPSGPPRPLTRRELRALEAMQSAEPDQAQEPDAAPSPELTGPEPQSPEPAPDELPADLPAAEGPEEPEHAAGEEPPEADEPYQPEFVPSAASTTGTTTWSDDVRWSLHGELPRELPPEPDSEDDVRWDFDTIPLQTLRELDGEDAESQHLPVEPDWPEEPEGEWPAQEGAGDETLAGEQPGVEDAAWPFGEPVGERPAPGVAAEPEAAGEAEAAPVPAWGAPTRVSAWASADVASPLPPEAAPPLHFEPDELDEPELPAAVAEVPGVEPELPTLSDLLAARPEAPAGPAEQGWQGTLRRLTGGLLALRPGPAEQRHRASVASVQRSLDGPRTVVVINPKGGAHKTTATLLLAATFGQHRGGYTLAWDNNETRGTLGWRAQQAYHHNTAVNLLQDLERFTASGTARVGDLDNYVRSQGSAQFDVLASDEDAASAASIDAFAFRALHRTLARFYRIMVIDTGNNMRASNWQAAVEAADQVVIVSTVREDTAQSAAWAIDALRATGHEEAVRHAVTVLSDPAPRRDPNLADRLHEHFGQLTRAVVDVPYDASLVGGTPLEVQRLDRRTREAWLHVAAAVAEGL